MSADLTQDIVIIFNSRMYFGTAAQQFSVPRSTVQDIMEKIFFYERGRMLFLILQRKIVYEYNIILKYIFIILSNGGKQSSISYYSVFSVHSYKKETNFFSKKHHSKIREEFVRTYLEKSGTQGFFFCVWSESVTATVEEKWSQDPKDTIPIV